MSDKTQGRNPVFLPAQDVTVTAVNLIWIRWLIGSIVILGTLFASRVLGLPMAELKLCLLGVAILLYNIPLSIITRRFQQSKTKSLREHNRRLLFSQAMMDWISMAVFLHLTGGITSPAMLIFLIHLMMIAVLIPDVNPVPYVALVTGAVISISALEWVGALSHYVVIPGIPFELYRNPYYVLAVIMFFASAAASTSFLTTMIMKRLRERERQVNALLDTTQAVSSTLSLPEVLEHLASNAAMALSVRKASIRLLDETGEVLNLAAAYGLSQKYREKGPVQVSLSALDEDALSAKPVLIADTSNDTRIQYPREMVDEGIGSLLVAPIIGRNAALGVLRVYSPKTNYFSLDDAEYVMAIANQGAVAIENAIAHEALQTAEQERAQFLRTITHELKAPVAGAQSLVRVLSSGLAGELPQEPLNLIERVGSRLDWLMELINDLLILAASRTPAYRETAHPVVLQYTLDWVLENLATESKEKGIQLHTQIPEKELEVYGTRDGLIKIFTNLIGNAIKYTPPDGRISIVVEEEANNIIVTITDTGMGIPEQDLPNLWKEFFRAGNARSSGIQGTGLGLTIVKRLTEAYKGRISVQTAENKGTSFILRFRRITGNDA